MGSRRIKVKHRPRSTPSLLGSGDLRLADENFGLTPILNAAFSRFMMDDRFRDTERVNFSMMRYAWGNWYPYAVEFADEPKTAPEADFAPVDDEMLQYLFFRPGPCPFCGKSVRGEPAQPKEFTWHRTCIVAAYARDAERWGSPQQKEWAASVRNGTG